jgi:hypothetical protein
MENIQLTNGRVALYKSSRTTKIPDMGIDEDIDVHSYQVPCPVCQHAETNIGHSRDGIFFLSNQIICRSCGVYFRPVVEPSYVAMKMSEVKP